MNDETRDPSAFRAATFSTDTANLQDCVATALVELSQCSFHPVREALTLCMRQAIYIHAAEPVDEAHVAGLGQDAALLVGFAESSKAKIQNLDNRDRDCARTGGGKPSFPT